MRKLMPKPTWVEQTEARISSLVPLHPNIISGMKLLIVAPLLVLSLSQVGVLPSHPLILSGLFVLFALLDYLDGLVARHRQLTTHFGRIFDRLTDYPVLLVLSYFCLDVLPLGLLALKLGLDLLLMILYLAGRGGTENRIRTALSYTTLFVLLALSQKWAPRLLSERFVIYLLWVNIAFSSVVVLFNLGALRKRFIADALSSANLLCGVFSILFAAEQRVDLSLIFLMLGAAFDGFDGAAARRFGGTRFGVYSDDIADGVNYGIAPGFALYFTLGGIEGVVIGAFYTIFTIGRLVYFTLNKTTADPNYFCGVPSTVGALVTLCSILLFDQRPVALGLMVGVACVQMVSFDTHYRHLGRALASNRRIIYGMPALLVVLIGGRLLFHDQLPFVLILVAALIYGFLPTAVHFASVARRRSRPSADLDMSDAAPPSRELADRESPETGVVIPWLGRLCSRMGHLSLPAAVGLVIGFYFADQGMRFMPTALKVALGLCIFGSLAIPLGRVIQGRAFRDTPEKKRIRKRVVFFAVLASLALVGRLLVFSTEADSQLTGLSKADFRTAYRIDAKQFRALSSELFGVVAYLDQPQSVVNGNQQGLLTADGERSLLTAWRRLQDSAFALDQIRVFYEDWYRFDPSRVEIDYHLQSFLLFFAAELTLFESAYRAVMRIKQNPNAEKFLNAPHPEVGLGADSLSRFRQELVGSREQARIAAGKQYLEFIETMLQGKDKADELGLTWLWTDTVSRIDAIEGIAPLNKALGSVRADLQQIKRTSRRQWFVTQKAVANWMGDTRVRRIGTYLVSRPQQEAMDRRLAPGDVLLARKNWYLSNVGLPGFWPHAILYIGDPQKLDAYFDTPDVNEWVGEQWGRRGSLSDYLAATFPRHWALYTRPRRDDPLRVIESISEGVLFNSLAQSCGDYVAAIRPRLSKKTKAQAIVTAFQHLGKPYDFDFDFATDHALVCTELVWRCYRPSANKEGLRFELDSIMGRLTLPANEIAAQYSHERGTPTPQFDFVYFIDANEDQQRAFVSTEEAFAQTYRRTKWDLTLP